MDLTKEIHKHTKFDVDFIIKRITANEKCVVCNKITTHKENKLLNNSHLNVYDGIVRAILCENCNVMELKIRNFIEDSNMSYDDILKKFDKNKIMNLFDKVYVHAGIVPMIIET